MKRISLAVMRRRVDQGGWLLDATDQEGPVNAVAISYNDMVYLHWSMPTKIPGRLGSA